MRCTLVLAALAAQALAQSSILPITQISDGQIQAPPATSVVPVPGSTDIVVPTTGVPVPIPSGSETIVIPLPTGSDSLVVPVPTSGATNGTVPTTSGTFSNSTASITLSTTGSGTAPPSTTTTGSGPPGNAAGSNKVSFGGLVLAVAAMVIA